MREYRVQLIVTVRDSGMDDAHDWEDVAKRVVRRVKSGARRPLDNDLRLRITGVQLDTAADDDA